VQLAQNGLGQGAVEVTFGDCRGQSGGVWGRLSTGGEAIAKTDHDLRNFPSVIVEAVHTKTGWPQVRVDLHMVKARRILKAQ
jgi:hypothetical protein